MTASRAPAEPEVREFEATVERVEDGGREVVLDHTYFYAESGGQPADRGTLGGCAVEHVHETDGEVVHVLAEPLDREPGETVAGVIDDAFRTYCTRAHTASHVLYGAARQICEDLGYAGFDIGTEKVRVDLTASEPLDDADLVELERLANRVVWDSLPVTWETMHAAEARALDDIAFNDKTEAGAMAGGGEGGATGRGAGGDTASDDAVRVVTVEGWDVAACGGTHVSNTHEIGLISVLDRSNPGEGVTRVEFAVGPSAVDRNAAVHAAALEAASAADANVESLPDAVKRLRETNEALEGDVAELRTDLLQFRLREFPKTTVTEEDGTETAWTIGQLADADPNDLREPASELVDADDPDAPDALAAVGDGPAPFLVVAAAPDSGVDAGEVVAAATDAFGGGGGGGPTFAQGGGLDADSEEVASWLRER
ncbi:hypothetical protein JCM17823_27950 [Halorubrum gandharaense]